MAIIWPFKKSKSYLGVDIGTAALRVVELFRYGDQERLENYAELPLGSYYPNTYKEIRKGSLLFSAKHFAELLEQILRESKIKSKRAIFALPDFSTLFTSFTLPPMAYEEVAQAVKFEARRHVPLPLSEVTLDWLITKGRPSAAKKEDLEVLMVVVPNRIIEHYTQIAELLGLQLEGLEAEVFCLQRALVKTKEKTICLIDIGAQSTTCSIVDKNILRSSYSFDLGGYDLTERVSKSMKLDSSRAEALKINRGLLNGGESDLSQVLQPFLATIAGEVRRVVDNYFEKEQKEVETYLVSGASAALPGLKDYFKKRLEKEIEIAFPFADMIYPSILEDELKKIGPAYSVGVGAALRGIAKV